MYLSLLLLLEAIFGILHVRAVLYMSLDSNLLKKPFSSRKLWRSNVMKLYMQYFKVTVAKFEVILPH